MKKLLTLLAASAVWVGMSTALAAEKPDADSALKVITYYFDGKVDGPVLMEFKPCLKVDNTKGSETRYDCLEEANGTVKKGTRVSAWTRWLVPRGGKYDDVAVQFVHNGMVRSTKDLSLSESLRMRTYKSETFSKTGEWEIKVMRGAEVLNTAKLTVTE